MFYTLDRRDVKSMTYAALRDALDRDQQNTGDNQHWGFNAGLFIMETGAHCDSRHRNTCYVHSNGHTDNKFWYGSMSYISTKIFAMNLWVF